VLESVLEDSGLEGMSCVCNWCCCAVHPARQACRSRSWNLQHHFPTTTTRRPILYRTYSDHKHSWKRFSVGKWLRCGCGLNSVGMRRANGTVLTILKWRRSTSRSQSVPVSAAVLSPKLYSRARHGWSEGRLRRAWG
jgi:hypothetical protein